MANKGRKPGADELTLWRRFTENVASWRSPDESEGENAPHKTSPAKPSPKRQQAHSQPPSGRKHASDTPRPGRLDRALYTKIAAEKIRIEGVIDLHGMTQAQAQATLERFILSSSHAGRRCLLAITGKGGRRANGHGPSPDLMPVSERAETGVLRARLPDWLGLPPLAALVLGYSTAAARHGGEGAFYIYLRRR